MEFPGFGRIKRHLSDLTNHHFGWIDSNFSLVHAFTACSWDTLDSLEISWFMTYFPEVFLMSSNYLIFSGFSDSKQGYPVQCANRSWIATLAPLDTFIIPRCLQRVWKVSEQSAVLVSVTTLVEVHLEKTHAAGGEFEWSPVVSPWVNAREMMGLPKLCL